ncbi:Saccharopine dehydrogenase-domain-containing protein [Trametes punicea]|nr:Saccharopine dehydrogenase-domain-containing protein [Trametes punicea]
MADILVVGATGFTGRLITRYLHNHPQRASFTFAIGVRSKAKGEQLKKSLGLDENVQIVQLDVASYDQVEAAVQDAKVVINAVGPYWRWGTNVVRACAVHGKRYVDLAGEPHFIRKIINLYDYLATKTGAIIVPSCGMDSVPADIMVYLSNQTLKKALGPQTELGLSETFYSMRVTPSGGTIATVLNTYEEAPRIQVEEARRDYALSPVKGAPSPRFRFAVREPFSDPPIYGAPSLIVLSNRPIVQRTSGLIQFALSSARTVYGENYASEKTVRPLAYGPHFRYAEYVVPGSGSFLSAVLMGTLTLAFSFLFVAPVRWLMRRLAYQPGEGPSEADMQKGYIKATNYTSTATAPQTWAKTVFHGQDDPGYLLTSVLIAECALGLLLDDDELPVTARPGGVLTPATALGEVIVRRLQATGRIQLESEILKSAEESRKTR